MPKRGRPPKFKSNLDERYHIILTPEQRELSDEFATALNMGTADMWRFLLLQSADQVLAQGKTKIEINLEEFITGETTTD